MLLESRLDPVNVAKKTIEAIENAISKAGGYKIYLDDIQKEQGQGEIISKKEEQIQCS